MMFWKLPTLNLKPQILTMCLDILLHNYYIYTHIHTAHYLVSFWHVSRMRMSWRMRSTWSAASRRHEQKHGALQFQFVSRENQPIEATVQQERLVSTGKFKDTARRLPAWGIGIQQWACCLFEHRQRRCFISWTYLEILHHLCTGCLHSEDVQRNSITMARMLSPEFGFLVIWPGFLGELRRWTWCWTTMALETRHLDMAIWERY